MCFYPRLNEESIKLFLIYQDYIHNNYPLFKGLVAQYGAQNVQWVTANDLIKKDSLTPDVTAFFMPGGADLYYCERLNGAANRKIRAYVEQGGTYMGICAGAYYAATHIEWLKGTYDEISEDRELAFFDGKAVGPIGDYVTMIGDRRIDAATAQLSHDGDTLSTFYWGGPLFVGKTTLPDNIDVIAYYTNLPEKPAAIIEIPTGKGKIILSSPHIEYTPQDVAALHYKKDSQTAHYIDISKALAKTDDLRLNLWNKILERL